MNTDLVTRLVALANTRGSDIAYQYFYEDGKPCRVMSYSELDERAKQVAIHLQQHFSKGDRALLLFNSGFEFVEAFFACLYAGIIAVPVYPPKKNQNVDRLRSIVTDAGAKGALTSEKIYEIARPLFDSEAQLAKLAVFTTDSESTTKIQTQQWCFSDILLDDLAFLQYTSGSTGNPKGVMVSHGNIIDNQEMMKIAFGHDNSTPIVSWLPHFHDMGLIFGILHPIYIGAPASLMNPTYFLQKPYRWLKLLSDTKAVTSSAPNFAYDLCVDTVKDADLKSLDLSHWRSALNGAEPVRASTLERFAQKFAECGLHRDSIAPCYGMAETTLFATGGKLSVAPTVLRLASQALKGGQARLLSTQESMPSQSGIFFDFDSISQEQPYYAVSCGIAWHNHTVAIVNPESKERCDDGDTGEIWVKGASVAQGYWGKEALTKEIFQAHIADDNDGPYLRTGDLGFIFQDELFVTGRSKDVLIFRGKNYYPQDIELTVSNANEALDANGGAAFSIVSSPDQQANQSAAQERLIIVQQVKRTAVRKLNPESVTADIMAAVTQHHGVTPYEVVLIKPGRILKTSSGKIQRQENKRHYVEALFSPLYRTLHGHELAESHAPLTAGSSQNASGKLLIEKLLQQVVGQELESNAPVLDVNAPFHSLGVDSMRAVRISGELMEMHGIELEATVLYEYPTIAQLSDYLWQFEQVQSVVLQNKGIENVINQSDMDDTVKNINTPIGKSTEQALDKRDVAVIGMACRYPQANNIEEFWQLICDKRDAISLPSERRQQLCPNLEAGRFGGYLEDIAQFDAALFGISPTEAKYIDPQHRLLLQVSYHAIQAGGYSPSALSGSNTGVYVGISQNDYFAMSQQFDKQNAYLGTGTALSIAANRLSYFYNFTGPSISIDTACSSSLVALHQAIQSIKRGEISQAVVCGVNLILSDEVTKACEAAQMLADDGRCKTFSDAADGYVRSEGVGCLFLKPLEEAYRAQDPIQGILKGSAVNQDGRSNGITAPNGLSQQTVIKAALDNAAVCAEDVQYVEAHGTGTKLGDPIELSALSKVYRPQGQMASPITVGAVKANIGHLESGAGIAGVIKTLLCMQHGKIPAQPHINTLNTHVPWAKMPLVANTSDTHWPKEDLAHYAGVSSFGFGGTNAHVICEAAPKQNPLDVNLLAQTGFYLLAVSAKTPLALHQSLNRYNEVLAKLDANEFDALVYNNAMQPHMREYKRVVHGLSRSQLLENLNMANKTYSAHHDGGSHNISELALLFTGQGAQYANMAKSLYSTQAVFKAAIDECNDLLEGQRAESLLDVLYGNPQAELFNEAQWTQICLFAVEYAFSKLLLSLGITPKYLVSHSVGEYAAACIAEVFSIEDAVKLIAARASLMAELPNEGRMISIRCTDIVAQEIVAKCHADCSTQVCICAFHAESGVVLSGHNTAIDFACRQLEQKKIKYREVNTARAFHSPLMAPMLSEFAKVANSITFSLPKYPYLSSVTGEFETDALTTPDYWVQQIIKPVRFDLCLHQLDKVAPLCTLEVGPKPVLSALVQENLKDHHCECLHVLHNKGEDVSRFPASIGRLFELGLELDWSCVYPQKSVPRQSLPAYPFDEHAHWIVPLNTQESKSKASNGHRHADEVNAYVKGVTVQGKHSEDRQVIIREFVLSTLANLLSMPAEAIQTDTPLLEMGVDSLMIMQAVRLYEREFGLEFSVRQFYEELSTVDSLLTYIVQHSDYRTQPIAANVEEHATDQLVSAGDTTHGNNTVASRAVGHINGELVKEICQAQLHAATQVNNAYSRDSLKAITAQQLQLLITTTERSHSLPLGQDDSEDALEGVNAGYEYSVEEGNVTHSVPQPPAHNYQSTANSVLPSFQKKQLTSQLKSERMQQHFAVLSEEYCKKTAKSKALISENRPYLADSRASAGFRLSSKELLYPIFSQRCEKSRIWDIDGNEYIDIAMDFGVNLFGHKPDFVTQALLQQVEAGLQLGLASPLACEVASLINDLTGLERVTFCNSGTEAVMTAVRLARNTTKREKVVQFSGAYHGHYDGTLAHALSESDVEPMCSGVRHGSISDNLVLEYADPKALETIRKHASSIAAVLVEPVQSRHPELQPWAFLKELRELTKELGIALIFDEMITGFRAHPGGVQGLLDIQADMATYGKIVGGGLPIGVVAGSHAYLDGIDGGVWQYGDTSYPQADTTFFAGTFCKHPLAMASAKAVLSEIKRQGPALFDAVNEKTTYLKETLNRFFTAEQIPISLEAFTSLFRFKFTQNLDVFFYEMLNRGVFIWEGRNCFLSAAHTDADVEAIIQVVQDSALSIKKAGYFGDSLALESQISGASENDAVPLSDAQQQLLALALRSEQGAKAYQLQATVKLTGAVNKRRLERSIREVIKQYPMLSYGVDSDTLCHRKGAFNQILMPVVTIDTDAQLTANLSALRYAPFDLDNDVLCRFNLVEDQRGCSYFSLVAHHILYDGVSLQIILKAIAAYYNQEVIEPANSKLDFFAYIQALKQYQQTIKFEEDRTFWLTHLATSCELALPTKFALVENIDAKEEMHFEVETRSIHLTEEAMLNVSQLAKRNGCGQFATLLSMYLLWLSKLTQQSVVTAGIPCSDRQLLSRRDIVGSSEDIFEPDILDSQLVGYCTNILPINIDVMACTHLGELIKHVQSVLLTAFEHQHYPYSALTKEDIHLPSTLFNMDKVPSLPAFAELSIDTGPSVTTYSQFELNCNVTQVGESWSLDIEFNKHKFDTQLFDGFIQSFVAFIEKGNTQDTLHSPACSFVTESAQKTLLEEQFNKAQQLPVDSHSSQPALTNYIEQFEQIVAQYPTHQALSCEEQTLTYEQLNRRVNVLAHHLRALDIGVGSLVAIALPRRVELVVSILAVLKTGAAYLPLDLAFPQARINYILNDAQACILLCDSLCDDSVLNSRHSMTVLDIDSLSSTLNPSEAPNLNIELLPTQPAYVIYTSGSTGQPKGVEINHLALINFLSAMVQAPGISRSDTLLSVTTIAFDIAMLELFTPMLVGAHVLLASEQTCSDPAAIVELLNINPVSIMQATPTLWQLLLDHQPHCVKGLKVLCGGEPLSKSLAKAFLKNDVELWNMYGPTETTIWSSLSHITDAEHISIGDGITNTSLYIMSDNVQGALLPLPTGVWGELCIGGVGLANGYFKQPQLTAQRFIEHRFNDQCTQRLYRTGDRARRLPNGEIELQGRLDQQVKLHGHRIELGDIEHHLRQILETKNVRVFIKQNAEQQASLCAYCIDDGILQTRWAYSEIRQALALRLPSYMVPESVCWLLAWPLTPNGKLDSNALPIPEGIKQRNIIPVEPNTATEEALHRCFLTLLNTSILGTQESFFECGGNSVLAMQLVSKINAQFGIRITVGDVFDHSSIALLAVRIDDLMNAMATCSDSSPDIKMVSDIVSGRDISAALDDESMTEMDL
ncbi:amino acid adenylation domain-containing protein [Pseudoalteromonas sp. MMG013]|uniref:non-ribosomal peptide synthetase/type I polyketide synthase n=1 Tax=Pseudoalteromonas sp. MMG013 TaxID=2822687 RepID=UPI001B35D983|nr:non-ribosomal peptide synthetase/type I polyketide synthase [Pseudoalteromonas sp. MMG013]MBQ4862864.1 amino acid adenylation domain-containing protein [Pseudoalteromonas sp. MMG013]